uniref:Amiloride-sensitive sodium channel n=1 Tax=Syphacia muris TaxID=451379 RepID=A0A0N5AIR1_9BILA
MSSSEARSHCLVGADKRKILKKFAETTSAHGFVLISKSGNIYARIGWIIVVSVLWHYYQWPTVTTVRIRHFTSLQFPAVTVCNLNPVRASWIRKQTSNVNEITRALELMKMRKNMSDSDWDEAVRRSKSADYLSKEKENLYHSIRSIFNKKVNLKEAGHDIKDMLLECTFQSTKCSAANFTRWEHGSYGNCYTIIITREHYSFIGPFHGLSMTLYTQDDEYLARSSQGAGFQVEVHSPEYIPFPEDKGFTVSPGVKTSVAIKLRQISRMPWPYDGTECGDYRNEGFVRKARCISLYSSRPTKRCILKDASSVTRADIELEFSSNRSIEACDMRSSGSKTAVCFRQSLANTAKKNICDTLCPQPCHEQEYITEKAFALWPRDGFYKTARETWENATYSKLTNLTLEKARTNLLKLEVYFKELNYEAIKEAPATDVWDLLSDIGGTLGLYVGVSFLTFGEVVELLIECATSPTKKLLRQRAAQKLNF